MAALIKCFYSIEQSTIIQDKAVHRHGLFEMNNLLSLASFYKKENSESHIKAFSLKHYSVQCVQLTSLNNVRIPITLMKVNTQGLLKVAPTHKDFSMADRGHTTTCGNTKQNLKLFIYMSIL